MSPGWGQSGTARRSPAGEVFLGTLVNWNRLYLGRVARGLMQHINVFIFCHHGVDGFKQQRVLLSSFWEPQVSHRPTWAEIKVWAGLHFLWTFRGTICPWPLAAPHSCCHHMACGHIPWVCRQVALCLLRRPRFNASRSLSDTPG